MTVPTRSHRPGPSQPGISALMRKDLAVFVPRDRFLVALIYLLAHPTVLPSQEAFFWLGISLAGVLALYVPIVEWHQETERMLSSLPLSRTTVVVSRFFSSVLACGVAGLAWVSTGRLLGPFFSSAQGTHEMWATLEGALAFVIMALLLFALFLPLYFRFGLGRGATIFSGLCLVLYVCLSLPAGLFAPGGELERMIVSLLDSRGVGWGLLLILLGLATVLSVSVRLSLRWFQRRDL